jgi:hypothetical protein
MVESSFNAFVHAICLNKMSRITGAGKSSERATTADDVYAALDCPICFDPLIDPISLPIGAICVSVRLATSEFTF